MNESNPSFSDPKGTETLMDYKTQKFVILSWMPDFRIQLFSLLLDR